MFYEIQDSNGSIFRLSDLYEAVKIYDTNWLRREYYEKKYDAMKEEKYKIQKWVGELRLVAIMESVGEHGSGKTHYYDEVQMG